MELEVAERREREQPQRADRGDDREPRWSSPNALHQRGGRAAARCRPPRGRAGRAARPRRAVAARRTSAGHGSARPSAARAASERMAAPTCARWTPVAPGSEVRCAASGARQAQPAQRVGPQPPRPAHERPAGRQRAVAAVRALDGAHDRGHAGGLLERGEQLVAVARATPWAVPPHDAASRPPRVSTSARSRATAASRAATRSASAARRLAVPSPATAEAASTGTPSSPSSAAAGRGPGGRRRAPRRRAGPPG